MTQYKEVNKQEFFKSLSVWNRCYMKKPKSWQKIWFWWEKDSRKPNEQWFMNIARSTRTEMEDSYWINAKNIEFWIDKMGCEGYKYYVSEGSL
jgi:hypothetical protein